MGRPKKVVTEGEETSEDYNEFKDTIENEDGSLSHKD